MKYINQIITCPLYEEDQTIVAISHGWVSSSREYTDEYGVQMLKLYVVRPEPIEKRATMTRVNAPSSQAFSLFWESYPKDGNSGKGSKKMAESSFRKYEKDADKIMSGLAKHKKSKQWIEKIIPHAVTFLNQERWQDDVMVSNDPVDQVPDEYREEIRKKAQDYLGRRGKKPSQDIINRWVEKRKQGLSLY